MTFTLKSINDISKDEFKKIFDTFPNRTFAYSYNWWQYCLAYAVNIVADLSFVCFQNNAPVAIAPLFLEEVNNEKTLSYSGSYGVCPLISSAIHPKMQKKTLYYCMKKTEELAVEVQCNKIKMRIDPLLSPDFQTPLYNYNFLMQFSYLNESLNTQIINLSKSREELKSELRESYKSLINNGHKNYSFEFYGIDIPREKFDIYREMHHAAAGRITRPLKTFDLMFAACCEGKGAVSLAKYGEQYVGAAWFSMENGTGYYGSGAELPNIDLPSPVGHYIQWNTMLSFKELGVKFYEIGVQQFSAQKYNQPNEKDLSISLYKRGFGGNTVSAYCGTKLMGEKNE